MSFKDVLKGHLSGFLGILTGLQAIARLYDHWSSHCYFY